MARKIVRRQRPPGEAEELGRRRPAPPEQQDLPLSAPAQAVDKSVEKGADEAGEKPAEPVRLSPRKPARRARKAGGRRIALFATCLVDLFRPTVGFAALKLLEDAGCEVVVPAKQTCCGQPAYNSGDRGDAKALAKRFIKQFEKFDTVVVPSGSCAGMIVKHYPELFEGDAKWLPRAEALAAKTRELTDFLATELKAAGLSARFDGIAAYHDSCSSLREMKVKAQPRDLLAKVEGLGVRDLPSAEVCCGFGGTFCVKYPDISNRMAGDKLAEVVESGADTLLAGDLGCLMNLAGKISRDGLGIRVYHVAEVLAGMADAPGLEAAAEAEGPKTATSAGEA